MIRSLAGLVMVAALGCGAKQDPVEPAQPVCPPAPAPAPAADPDARGFGTTKTINQTVTMYFKPEHEAEFLALAAKVVPEVYATQPGVLTYVLTKLPNEPHAYMWIERYIDEDAAKKHAKAPYFDGLFPKLKLWFSKPPVLTRYEQVLPVPR
ncbi:MAG TPA: putative quinol monooxygenase [Kofleriaceae bacterium]